METFKNVVALLLALAVLYFLYLVFFHIGINAVFNPFGSALDFSQSQSVANGSLILVFLLKVVWK